MNTLNISTETKEKDFNIVGKTIDEIPKTTIRNIQDLIGKIHFNLMDEEVKYIVNKLTHDIQAAFFGYSDKNQAFFKQLRDFIRSKIEDAGKNKVYLTEDEFLKLKEINERNASLSKLGLMILFKDATLETDPILFLSSLYHEFILLSGYENWIVNEISRVLSKKIDLERISYSDKANYIQLKDFLEYQINMNLNFKPLQLTENDLINIGNPSTREDILTKIGLNLIFNSNAGNDTGSQVKHLSILKLQLEQCLQRFRDKKLKNGGKLMPKKSGIPAKKLRGLR